MTRRLNKQLAETIRANVLAATDLFSRRDAIIAATKEAAKAWVASVLPKELREFAASRPKEWFHTINSVPCNIEDNPLKFLCIESSGRPYWRRYAVDLDDPVVAPSNFPGEMELALGVFADFDACITKAGEWETEYRRVAEGLSAMLASARTVEALVARMPELAPYIPAGSNPAYALVAPSNLLADLARCGFKEPA